MLQRQGRFARAVAAELRDRVVPSGPPRTATIEFLAARQARPHSGFSPHLTKFSTEMWLRFRPAPNNPA